MKKLNLVIMILVVLGIFAGLILCKSSLWKRVTHRTPTQSFTIAKAWWPIWDTFQIGVRRREEVKQSFKTTFLQKENYVPALNEFQIGKADAATLTIYEVILAASKGISLKIVLLLDYTTGSDGVVAKKTIQSLQELKGKRIGVEKGTIAHFTLIKMLEKAGLDQAEVKLINLNVEALQQSFLHEEVDAVATYEPYMSNLVQQGDGHVIFSSREIPRAICDVLFVKDEIVRDHPGVIDHWIEAWNDVLNFKESDPEGYLSNLNRLNGTPISSIKESFKGIFFTNLAENRVAFGTPDSPGYLMESLKEMESFMLENGVIQKRVLHQGLIDSDGIHRFFKRK